MPARRGKARVLRTLDDLVPDDCNTNAGTERGRGALERSVEDYGIGRGILVDRKGKLIAGGHLTEVLREKGLTDVVVVPTTGTTLVVTQRTDLDMDQDPKARELALADNRTNQLGFRLDVKNFQLLSAQGVDLAKFYVPEELNRILHALPETDGGPDVHAKPGRGGGPLVRFSVNLSPEDHLLVTRAMNHVRASGASDAAAALVTLAKQALGES